MRTSLDHDRNGVRKIIYMLIRLYELVGSLKPGYEVLASEQLAPEESPPEPSPELAPEHSAIV